MRRLLTLSTLLALTGCPEPLPEAAKPGVEVAVVDPGSAAPTELPGAPAPASGPPSGDMPSGSAATAGGPASAGTFGEVLPESELLPKYTQAQLSDGVEISGTLACADCTGQLLVRLLPPPPGEESGGTDADSIQLVTLGVFDGVGDFKMKGPQGQKVVLQVVDDANSDGKPSAGERMGMSADGPVTLTSEVTGLSLEVGVFPNQPMPTPDGPSPTNAGQVQAEGAPTPPAEGGGAMPPAEGAAPGEPGEAGATGE